MEGQALPGPYSSTLPVSAEEIFSCKIDSVELLLEKALKSVIKCRKGSVLTIIIIKKRKFNEIIQGKHSAQSLASANHPLYGRYDLISSTRLVMKSNIHIHLPLPGGMAAAIFIN